LLKGWNAGPGDSKPDKKTVLMGFFWRLTGPWGQAGLGLPWGNRDVPVIIFDNF